MVGVQWLAVGTDGSVRSVGCVKRRVRYGLWCVSRTLKFTTSERKATGKVRERWRLLYDNAGLVPTGH